MAKSKKTTKHFKRVVGTKDYIDPRTGEWKTFLEQLEEDKDFNFDKLWIANAIEAIKAVGNKKTEILTWLMEHKRRDNTLPYTYEHIANHTGTSWKTVAVTMSELLKADFIRKNKGQTGYMINPDTLFYGDYKQRQYILNVYQGLDYEEPKLTDEEIARNILRSIAKLQKKLEQLNIDESKIIDFPSDSVSEDRLSN